MPVRGLGSALPNPRTCRHTLHGNEIAVGGVWGPYDFMTISRKTKNLINIGSAQPSLRLSLPLFAALIYLNKLLSLKSLMPGCAVRNASAREPSRFW
jgi:hypothetical protein